MLPDLSLRQRVIALVVLAAAAIGVILLPTGAPSSASTGASPKVSRSISSSMLSDEALLSAARSAATRRLFAAAAHHHARHRHPQAASPAPAASTPPPQPSYPAGTLTAAQVGRLWLRAGGSPAAEQTAICIAYHESQFYVTAHSPTNDYGLWQINGSNNGLIIYGVPGLGTVTIVVTYTPLINARDAVALSRNGTDWGDWTTHYACGV